MAIPKLDCSSSTFRAYPLHNPEFLVKKSNQEPAEGTEKVHLKKKIS